MLNLTVEHVAGVGSVKCDLPPSRFVKVAHRFVAENDALFSKTRQVAIEIQMGSKMAQLAQALAGVIKGRHPEILVRHVSPVATRAFYNTSVRDPKIPKEDRYPLRKALSVQLRHKLLAREAVLELERAFGAKMDDAVEAGLLAVYADAVPEPVRRVGAKDTKAEAWRFVRSVVPWASAADIVMTEPERESVLRNPPPRVRKERASKKKRAREAEDNEPSKRARAKDTDAKERKPAPPADERVVVKRKKPAKKPARKKQKQLTTSLPPAAQS